MRASPAEHAPGISQAAAGRWLAAPACLSHRAVPLGRPRRLRRDDRPRHACYPLPGLSGIPNTRIPNMTSNRVPNNGACR